MSIRGLSSLNIGTSTDKGVSDDLSIRRQRHDEDASDTVQAGKPRGDAFERTPDIEHFNNYSRRGTHVDVYNTRSAAQSMPHEMRKTIVSEPPDIPINETVADENEKLLEEASANSLSTPSEKMTSKQAIQPILVSSVAVDQAYLGTSSEEVGLINAYMHKGFLDFVAGRIGVDEIAELAERMYRDILAYNIKMGRTDGNDIAINEKLVRDTHMYFSYYAVDSLYWDMHDKGFEYGKETFGFTHPISDHFSYYDASYYYASKELQAIGDAVFSRIAKDEGLSGFRAAYVYEEGGMMYSFNTHYASRDHRVMVMKDVNLAPPRDFKMFYSPTRYGLEAWLNGTDYVVSANDPLKHNGLSGYDCYIRVPKGMQLWKTLPFWLQQTKIDHSFASNHPCVVGAYDISKYIAPGADFDKSLKDFIDEYMTDFFSGALTIWSNDTIAEYNVPFNIIIDDIRQFDGSQLVPSDSYAGFMSNFEFHMYRQ